MWRQYLDAGLMIAGTELLSITLFLFVLMLFLLFSKESDVSEYLHHLFDTADRLTVFLVLLIAVAFMGAMNFILFSLAL